MFLLGAGITAGAGLVGSAIAGAGQAKAARETNKTNIMLTRETNAQHYKMFQEQNAFNREMYMQQLAYNTPSAQRQRYEDAGLNPYIAMGQIASGNVQSSLQSAQSPTLNNPQVQSEGSPLQYIGSGVANVGQHLVDQMRAQELHNAEMVIKMKQAENIEAQTEGTKIQNDYDRNTLFQRVGIKTNEYNNSNIDAKHYQAIKDMSITQMEQNINSTYLQNELIEAQKVAQELQNEYFKDTSETQKKMLVASLEHVLEQSISLRHSRQMAEGQLKLGWANNAVQQKQLVLEAKKLVQNEKLLNAQVGKLVAETAKIYEEKNGIKLTNEQQKQLHEYVLGKAKEEFKRLKYDNKYVDNINWLHDHPGDPTGGLWDGVDIILNNTDHTINNIPLLGSILRFLSTKGK